MAFLSEQVHRMNIEQLGDLDQATRAYAVGALLVFLHLLEGQAEHRTKLLLRETEAQAMRPDPPAKFLVECVFLHRRFAPHLFFSAFLGMKARTGLQTG